MLSFRTSLFFGMVAVLFIDCASPNGIKMNRTQLISQLEQEMARNTQWLRIHAAEGLLDNGESTHKVAELFRLEADTATPPYRIGVWRVLARTTSGEERSRYIERIRAAMRDPKATDRISASESIGKLNAAIREDREIISEWLKIADEATAPFPAWLLVLSSNPSERAADEARLAHFLNSADPIARLRAAFALGRLQNLSVNSISTLRRQLPLEPKDSIARVYLITALLLHSQDIEENNRLEKELLVYRDGKANEQLELGIVTGLRRKNEHAPVLEALLQHSEPDARIGAANGLLRLTK